MRTLKKPTLIRSSRSSVANRVAALVLGIVLALVVVQAIQATATAESPPPTASADFAAIDKYVQEEMEETRLPGLALGIVHGDQVVHLKGFGKADPSGREVTPQTPFLIASVTKSITALAVMQLVEEGKVELDAPVQSYLPWFRVADPEASAKITVRQLLNHTSGLPSLTGGEYEMVLNTDLGEGALEQRVRALRTTRLIAPPGEVFQYSNAGYATLALVLQAASGESYEHYLQQHIYDPLQMDNSFVSKQEAQRHGMATGYRYWFGIPRPFEWSYSNAEFGGGFTISSAQDLTHFLIAQLNGGRYGGTQVLSPQGIAELHRPAARTQWGGPASSADESYGLGWFVKETDGVQIVEHSGVAPNFHADLVLVPEGEWGIVLLMNGQNSLRPERINAIASGVTALLVGKEPPPVAQNFNSRYLALLRYVLAVDAILLIGALWSVLTLRRWRAQPERRPRGLLRVAWHVVMPLVPYLLWALVSLVVVPLFVRSPLQGLVFEMPDFGYTLILSGAFALGWGILRTVLVILALRKRGAPKEPGAPNKTEVPVKA
jgi:CubicO group peptidase (beta-lactamase class C family)